jgi:putative tryptophan/tyrosine transport system substrate-binding protein
MMRRRAFAAGMVALVAWPVTARSQTRPKLIAFLSGATENSVAESGTLAAFRAGMKERGYVEGKDYVLVGHYADGETTRVDALAREIVRLNPDLILLSGTPATVAARAATSTIPIVSAAVTAP